MFIIRAHKKAKMSKSSRTFHFPHIFIVFSAILQKCCSFSFYVSQTINRTENFYIKLIEDYTKQPTKCVNKLRLSLNRSWIIAIKPNLPFLKMAEQLHGNGNFHCGKLMDVLEYYILYICSSTSTGTLIITTKLSLVLTVKHTEKKNYWKADRAIFNYT